MKKFQKIISLFLSLSLTAMTVAYTLPKPKAAETIASLKEEQNEIKSKIDESERKLSKLESEINSQEAIVTELNKQLSNLTDEYENVKAQKEVVDGEIAETQQNIEDLTDEIAAKDKEIKDTVDLFCKRLRANYMAGGKTNLEILTNSSSVSVFLNRLEMLKRVTDNDQALVDELNKEIKELEDAKKELEEEKQKFEKKQEELAVVVADLEATLAEIEAKSAEVDRRIAQLENAASEVENDLTGFDEQEAAIQKEINRLYAKQKAEEEARRKAEEARRKAEEQRKKQQKHSSGSGSSSSGSSYVRTPDPSSGFAFPIYSSCYISSGYGYRSASISGNAFHGGIDITGGNIYGQPVHASRSGTVIIAEHYSNSGYGHYVMLDHGDGYQTLYGHCSSVAVNYGDYVHQGDVIAYVGSTGNSTGPHLHFEVRYQNDKRNPLNYVSM